jgi:transcriptional regulator with XRE-family HTH domain
MLINFKVALGLKGERQVDLALRCGVDPTLLSQVINERREASPDLRTKLAAALSVSEKWLFTKRTQGAFQERPKPRLSKPLEDCGGTEGASTVLA